MSKSEFLMYVSLLEDLNGKKEYLDYELLKKDLLVEFGIKVTIENIRSFFDELLKEPSVKDDLIDLEIMYNNVC